MWPKEMKRPDMQYPEPEADYIYFLRELCFTAKIRVTQRIPSQILLVDQFCYEGAGIGRRLPARPLRDRLGPWFARRIVSPF